MHLRCGLLGALNLSGIEGVSVLHGEECNRYGASTACAVATGPVASAGGAIGGVGLLAGDGRIQQVLYEPDFLYTLVVKHPDGALQARVIGSRRPSPCRNL